MSINFSQQNSPKNKLIRRDGFYDYCKKPFKSHDAGGQLLDAEK
jgi:hypothetical protein